MPKPDLTFLNISQGTIQLLERRGMSLTDIAELLEVSKSYISRVKAGSRSFTLQHLGHISTKMNEDLPLLLFGLMVPESVRPENRKLYDMTRKLLERTSTKRKKKAKAA